MCETSERLQQLLMGAWSTGCHPAQNASYDHDGHILVVCATEFCARCSNTCVAFPLCAGVCSYPLGVDEWLLSSAAFATTARVKSTSELDDNETCMCNIAIGVRYCCSQLLLLSSLLLVLVFWNNLRYCRAQQLRGCCCSHRYRGE